MTVTNSSSKQSAQAMNGVATVFSFTFEALTDITQLSGIKAAILNTVTSVQTDLIYNDGGSLGYTVSVNANGVGGSITVNDFQTTDYTITIYREYAELQETNYADYNAFPSETVEDNQDLLTFIAQQQSEVTNRSIVLPITTTGVSTELPTPVADQFIGWNATANALINLPDPTIAADAAAAAAAASAAAALVSEGNAATSETNAAASAAAAAADVVLTNADVVLTNADVVLATAQVALAATEVTYAAEWANKAYASLISAAAGGDLVDDYSALSWSVASTHWATEVEDTPIPVIDGGDGATTFSALHWAAKAQAFAAAVNLPTPAFPANEGYVMVARAAASVGDYDLEIQGTSTLVDDFTIKNNGGVIEVNPDLVSAIIVNRMAILAIDDTLGGDYTDGVADTYNDQTGIDLGASLDEVFEVGSYRTPIATLANSETLKINAAVGGAQDSVVDSSGQNHVITRNGNATLSPNHYKWGNGSAYFGVVGQQLSVTDNADFAFGTGSINFDFWFKQTNLGSFQVYYRKNSGAGQVDDIYTYIDADNSLHFVTNDANGAGIDVQAHSAGSAVTDNEWHHMVSGRVGTELFIYLDGYQIAYGVGTAQDMTSTGSLFIQGHATNSFLGYIDDFRVTTGNNPFSAAPIAQPYLHFTMDEDAASTTVTDFGSGANNGTTVSGNTEDFHADGKVRFGFDLDGVADYFTANGAVASIAADTSGSITAWVNFDAIGIGAIFTVSDTAVGNEYIRFLADTNNLVCTVVDGGTQNSITSNVPLTTDTWKHVAVTQDGAGNGFTLYIDGVDVSGATVGTQTFWLGSLTSLDQLTIGALIRNSPATNFLNGRIDDVRYYSGIELTITEINSIRTAGIAGYYGLGSPNITVPTAAHTTDANTMLLLPFDTTTIGNDLVDIGSGANAPQVVTSILGAGVTGKFGSAYGSFPGASGDYFESDNPNPSDFSLQADNEFSFWFRQSSSAATTQGLFRTGNTGTALGYDVYINTSDGFHMRGGNGTGLINTIFTSAPSIVTDSNWHFFNLSKVDGVLGAYLDGTQVAHGPSNLILDSTDVLRVGTTNETVGSVWNNGGVQFPFGGDIDGFNVNQGNPLSATPSGTLVAFDGTDITPATMNLGIYGLNPTINGAITNASAVPLNLEASYLESDGASGSFLSLATNPAWESFSSASQIITMSAWVYLDTSATDSTIFASTNVGSSVGWQFGPDSANTLRWRTFGWAGTNWLIVSAGGLVPDTTWTHVAAYSDGSGTRAVYVNGVEVASSNVGTFETHGEILTVFAANTTGTVDRLDGRMEAIVLSQSNYLGVTGTIGAGSVYTTPVAGITSDIDSITVPTTEAVADANSVLLLNCNSLDESDSQHVVSFNGGMLTAENFAPLSDLRGSLSLDGTSYLSSIDSADWDILASVATTTTIDLWVKHNSLSLQAYVSHYADTDNQWALITDGTGIGFLNRLLSANQLFTGYVGDISDLGWHHVSLVKVLDEYAIYIDGIQESYDQNTDLLDLTAPLYIGSRAATTFMDGYLSDLRITDNNAFNATLMPEPYLQFKLNDALATNVVLDTGIGANNGTSVGDTTDNLSAVGVLPVGTPLAFDINGSSEYVTANAVATAIASDTTGTICAWINSTDVTTTGQVFALGASATNGHGTFKITASTMQFHLRDNGTNRLTVTATATLVNNTWTHVAITQDGVAAKIYVNGVEGTNAPSAGTIDQWFADVTTSTLNNFDVGALDRNAVVSGHFSGLLDDVRYYQEALTQTQIDAIYNTGTGTEGLFADESITVPTTKHVADGNTVLLANFEPGIIAGVNSGLPLDLFDYSTTPHTLTAVNGASVTGAYKSTTPSGRLTFDGVDDYITVPGNTDFNPFRELRTDYTIHLWVRMESQTGTDIFMIVRDDANNKWQWENTVGTGIEFLYHANSVPRSLSLVGTEISDSLWHHLTFIKIGSEDGCECGLYKDGDQIAYDTLLSSEISTPLTNELEIGSTVGSFFFHGDMDSIVFQPNNDVFSALPNVAVNNTITVPIAEPVGVSTPGIMTLQSVDVTALASPDDIKIYFDLENIDPTVVLNTDIIVGVRRNTGDSYKTAVMTVVSGTSRRIIEATVDMTTETAGTDVSYQVQTANDIQLRLHAVTMIWD